MADTATFSIANPAGMFFWMFVLILAAVGALLAATPYLMPKSECFAVTVPDAVANDPYLKRLKRRYLALTAAATAVVLAVSVGVYLTFAMKGFVIAFTVGLVGLCPLSFGLMLCFRAKVRAYKRAQGWKATEQQSVALVGDEPLPHALSMKWDLLFLALAALTAAVGAICYPLMPERIPMHFGFGGEVTTWADKSWGVAAFPVLFVLFMGAAMTFSHWTIVLSKKASSADAPVATAWAYGTFARAQSTLLVSLGTLLGLLGPIMELTFAGVFTLQQVLMPILAVVFVCVVASIAVSVVYGQNGSRLVARMQESSQLSADNDRYWKAGIFYVNPNDPSLFLPERFGIGWTMNLGRPAVWGILAAFALLIVGFCVGCFLLVG